MIHDAGDVSQWGSGCMSTVSSLVQYVALNCPNSSVVNLQECGVWKVAYCTCYNQSCHATVTCQKCETHLSPKHASYNY